jgi:hypothetical protein
MANILSANSANVSKSENAVMSIEGLKVSSFFITNFTIPGISTGTTDIPNPFKTHNAPGTRLTFEELSFTMIVTEDFSNWLEVYEWIKEGNNGFTFSTADMSKRHGSIYITTNNMNAKYRIEFKNMFPTTLSSIDVDVQQQEPVPLQANCTMFYESYDFKNIT